MPGKLSMYEFYEVRLMDINEQNFLVVMSESKRHNGKVSLYIRASTIINRHHVSFIYQFYGHVMKNFFPRMIYSLNTIEIKQKKPSRLSLVLVYK